MPSAPTTADGSLIPERILAFGDTDTGKTHAFCSIAKWHQLRNSPAHFFAIDTENAYARMLAPTGDFADLTNITRIDVDTWPDYVTATEQVWAGVEKGRGDWVSLDLAHNAWEEAQNEFARRVWGEDYDQYWLENPTDDKGNKTGSPVEGWDWGIINRMYRQRIRRLFLRLPAHMYVATMETGLNPLGEKDPEILSTFGRFGVKPAGQKALAHDFHTVLRFTQSAKKGRLMTMAKDRGREHIWEEKGKSQPIGSFWHPYLLGIAGWSM